MSTNGDAIGAEYMLPAGLPPGTYNGTALVLCENFCSDLDPFTITIVEDATISLTQTNTGCVDEALNFVASPAGLLEYVFFTDVDGDGVEEVLQAGASDAFTSSTIADGVQLFVRTTGLGDCMGEASLEVARVDPCAIYDVALMKLLVSTGPFSSGDLVEFQIEVFNQGNLPVYNVLVADYLPVGLDFFAADNSATVFAANPDTAGGMTVSGMATTSTPTAAGSSVQLSIFLRVNAAATNGTLFNVAEILSATGDPEGNNPITDQDDDLGDQDGGLTDEEDNNIDDETAGGTDNSMDEDDFDFAALQICTIGCNGTFPWNGQN